MRQSVTQNMVEDVAMQPIGPENADPNEQVADDPIGLTLERPDMAIDGPIFGDTDCNPIALGDTPVPSWPFIDDEGEVSNESNEPRTPEDVAPGPTKVTGKRRLNEDASGDNPPKKAQVSGRIDPGEALRRAREKEI
jgi:hypothetical protein